MSQWISMQLTGAFKSIGNAGAVAGFVVVAAVASGCASQTAKQSGTRDGSHVEAPRKSAAVEMCQKSMALFDQGETILDGESLAVYTDRSKQQKSLCEVLVDSGKKVAIFQFAGVDCLSCQEEAEDIQARIKKHPQGKDVAHVLVMTDFFADYNDEEFERFSDAHAPSATMVFDEARLWKHFSEDSSMPNRATIVAMNLAAEAVVINREGEAHGIFDAAIKLLK